MSDEVRNYSDEDLYLLLRRIGRYLHGQMGGKVSQKRLITILYTEGDFSQKHLLKRLDIQAGSLSELLNKVESNGWIIRQENPNDRRGLNITLTNLGKEKAQEFLKQREEIIEQLFLDFTGQQKQELGYLLSKFEKFYK